VTSSILILLFVSGCAEGLPGSFCRVYEPVYNAHKVCTKKVAEEVDVNNAVYMDCEF